MNRRNFLRGVSALPLAALLPKKVEGIRTYEDYIVEYVPTPNLSSHLWSKKFVEQVASSNYFGSISRQEAQDDYDELKRLSTVRVGDSSLS